VEIKKITLYFCISLFLTGCFQSSAMVGPAITFASTGNVSQAGLAYFTNRAVKEETGMSTTEYVSTYLVEKTKKTKKAKKNEKIYEELMILVQTNFAQTRKQLLLQNQSKITN
jgi:hypothetical protein